MLGKQAKVLSRRELQRLLDHVTHGRHPERDKVMILLSFRAGLRAKEISGLRWSMVTDASGMLADTIALPNKASKGRNGGRFIPLHDDLRDALISLMAARLDKVGADRAVIYSERADRYSANTVAVWFFRNTVRPELKAQAVIPGAGHLLLRWPKELSRQADHYAMCSSLLGTLR